MGVIVIWKAVGMFQTLFIIDEVIQVCQMMSAEAQFEQLTRCGCMPISNPDVFTSEKQSGGIATMGISVSNRIDKMSPNPG